jgi:hypothetical protein
LSHSAKDGDMTIRIMVQPFSKAMCIMCCCQVSLTHLGLFLDRSRWMGSNIALSPAWASRIQAWRVGP